MYTFLGNVKILDKYYKKHNLPQKVKSIFSWRTVLSVYLIAFISKGLKILFPLLHFYVFTDIYIIN